MDKPVKRRTPGPKPDRNWPAVKQAYLTEYAEKGAVDMRALATRYNIPYGSVRNRASKYKWHQDAAEMEAEVTARVREQILPKIVDARAKLLEDQLTFVGYLKKRAMNDLTKVQTLPVHIASRMVFDAMKVELSLTSAKQEAEAESRSGSEREDLMNMFRAFSSRNADKLTPASGA